ncbi:MAG: RluA family pseudouridine synthase [Lachnospiraceae bacterium]|nr:RluA family pseudouridine synthase [Lachnospiraceae bacterium]
MIFYITNEDINKRLDVYLKEKTDLSRTYIASLIEEGYIKINDIIVYKSSYKTRLNDVIFIQKKDEEVLDILPVDIPLDIIYEDDDILIIDKQKGLVVHPSNGHISDTLVNAIMYHCKDHLSTINGILRPGIVHRIDKDTSGLLVVCKNDTSHIAISKQFAEHSQIRKYYAIVKGSVSFTEKTIDAPIGRDKRNRKKMAIDNAGKEAITIVRVLKRYDNYTFVECELKTGRTHQIRVHMSSINHPVLGDLVYGKKDRHFQDIDTQCLHAYYMSFIHPTSGERVTYETKIPSYMIDILDKIEKNNL